MNRLGTIRNIAIVLVIAAAIEFLPGGGRAANLFDGILSVAFAAGIVYLGVRLYREHRIAIDGLGRRRAVLYGAIGLAIATIAAQSRMWQSGLGEFVWFLLILAVVYALVDVYRFSRSY